MRKKVTRSRLYQILFGNINGKAFFKSQAELVRNLLALDVYSDMHENTAKVFINQVVTGKRSLPDKLRNVLVEILKDRVTDEKVYSTIIDELQSYGKEKYSLLNNDAILTLRQKNKDIEVSDLQFDSMGEGLITIKLKLFDKLLLALLEEEYYQKLLLFASNKGVDRKEAAEILLKKALDMMLD